MDEEATVISPLVYPAASCLLVQWGRALNDPWQLPELAYLPPTGTPLSKRQPRVDPGIVLPV